MKIPGNQSMSPVIALSKNVSKKKNLIKNSEYKPRNEGRSRSRNNSKLRIRNNSNNQMTRKRSTKMNSFWKNGLTGKDDRKDRHIQQEKIDQQSNDYVSLFPNYTEFKDNDAFISKEEFNFGLNLNGEGNQNLMKINHEFNKTNSLLNINPNSIQNNSRRKCRAPNCIKATNDDFCSPVCMQVFERVMGFGNRGAIFKMNSDSQILKKNQNSMIHQFGSISMMNSNTNSDLISNSNITEYGHHYPKKQFNLFSNQPNPSVLKNKFFDLSKSSKSIFSFNFLDSQNDSNDDEIKTEFFKSKRKHKTLIIN
jgi:hypothetical protein